MTMLLDNVKLPIQWNPSYLGGLVPAVVCISEMSVTMNQVLNTLVLHIEMGGNDFFVHDYCTFNLSQ